MEAKVDENKTEDFNRILTLIEELSQTYLNESPSVDTTISDSWLNTIQPEFLFGNPSAPLDCKENYQLNFSLEEIRGFIRQKTSSYHLDVVDNHINTMIMYGLEYGNDLEAIEYLKEIKPAYLHYFRKLIVEYKLETKAFECRETLTLTRVCLSYPFYTCLYLHENKINNPNHAVSLELMESIINNYPRVMMTFAFAFLIPNQNNTFCSLLKKAHMLYQYIYFIRVVNPHIERIVDRIISHVISYTEALINKSNLIYNMQIKSLIKFGLLTVNDEEITVIEKIVETAKIWDLIVEKASSLLKVPNLQSMTIP